MKFENFYLRKKLGIFQISWWYLTRPWSCISYHFQYTNEKTAHIWNTLYLTKIWGDVRCENLLDLALLRTCQIILNLKTKIYQFPDTLTRYWSSNDFLLRIQQFCHLLNMAHPPAKEKITLDFCFLLLMSRQWRAFLIEWKLKGQYNPAGTNDNVQHLLDEKNVDNPVPDFITYTR